MAAQEEGVSRPPDDCEIIKYLDVSPEEAASVLHPGDDRASATSALVHLRRQKGSAQSEWANEVRTLEENAALARFDCSSCEPGYECMVGRLILGLPLE